MHSPSVSSEHYQIVYLGATVPYSCITHLHDNGPNTQSPYAEWAGDKAVTFGDGQLPDGNGDPLLSGYEAPHVGTLLQQLGTSSAQISKRLPSSS